MMQCSLWEIKNISPVGFGSRIKVPLTGKDVFINSHKCNPIWPSSSIEKNILDKDVSQISKFRKSQSNSFALLTPTKSWLSEICYVWHDLMFILPKLWSSNGWIDNSSTNFMEWITLSWVDMKIKLFRDLDAIVYIASAKLDMSYNGT